RAPRRRAAVSPEEAALARQALRSADGCARRLARSQGKLAAQFPLSPARLTALPPDLEDDLDAFLKRYEQLVNTIQDELFKVVAIGGGIAGCSVAYHLTKLGWRDVLLLERRDVSCGTTWHAAGLVGQLRATENLTKLAKYGAELYERLEAETGQATGFRRPGSVSVARTRERMHEPKA